MASIRTRFKPFDRAAVLRAMQGETPKEQSARHAAFARQQLAAAQEVNRSALGITPDHETFVDGRKGAAPEEVKPGGVIVFEFALLFSACEWIAATLLEHSPVRSGAYVRSFVFTADGDVVDPMAGIPEAREYVFTSTAAYARKIERGLSPQAPDGVFEAVAALAARRFGNIASIKFSYRNPLFGGIDAWAKGTALSSKGHARNGAQRDEWLRRQPAIVITR